MTSKRLFAEYQRIRHQSLALCEGLRAEDMVVQSMPDASPSKWHLAHTSWFFETFVLKQYLQDFKLFDPQYPHLFNSYYESEGDRHARPQRGLLTRPYHSDILAYRAHVDDSMARLFDSPDRLNADGLSVIEIGLHHEMQHQELILTDIKHVLYQNAFNRAVTELSSESACPTMEFDTFDGGLVTIGHVDDSFSYDCEQPAHKVWLQPFELADRPVNNADWLAFMQDGAYQDPLLWLSDGWHTARKFNWQAPLYWEQIAGAWHSFDFDCMRPVDLGAPVCHISYYEAQAFAQWSGKRLPTEQEWEHVAQQHKIEGRFLEANVLETGMAKHHFNPAAGKSLYGDVWEWTQSAFLPYPGFRAEQGALGEYNGKFMVGQQVLRGGSCVTPQAQLRASYRNFFAPHHRWQFSGLRLASA